MLSRAAAPSPLTRREMLTGAAVAAAVLAQPIACGRAFAQTPRRGGVLTVRAWDPPHFDPHQTISYKMHIAYSFTHSRLLTKEYGAYISTTFYGKFDSIAFGPKTGFLEPDNFLFGQYYPGELKNQSHFNDPIAADMLIRQRRTHDLAKRRELIFEIQRYLAKQQYYVQLPSPVHVSVWDSALKNYAPNFGYDYGGRLMAAWLER